MATTPTAAVALQSSGNFRKDVMSSWMLQSSALEKKMMKKMLKMMAVWNNHEVFAKAV